MKLLNKICFWKNTKTIDEATLNSMGIKTAKIERVGIDAIDVSPNKRTIRVLYIDTNEEVVVDMDSEEFDYMFESGRPVKILGFTE